MEPHYGDRRNPGDATKGWLAENFGIRFRFNAVDWKPGASGIVDPDVTEGLTEGAGPVLIAAGATLAIVDETKAKGLVYFSDIDNPNKSLAVQLPSEFRGEFNPIRNPDIVGEVIVVAGRRNRYMNLPGLKNVQAISVQSPPGEGN